MLSCCVLDCHVTFVVGEGSRIHRLHEAIVARERKSQGQELLPNPGHSLSRVHLNLFRVKRKQPALPTNNYLNDLTTPLKSCPFVTPTLPEPSLPAVLGLAAALTSIT